MRKKTNTILNEAISYFHVASKYGYDDPTEDMTDEEIIKEYRKCLAHENVDEEDS